MSCAKKFRALNRASKHASPVRVHASMKPLSVAAAAAVVSPSEAKASEAALKDFRVTIFSAQQYVKDFLEKPMMNVFPETDWVEGRLERGNTKLAEGCQAVVAFVNDDLSEQVLEQLHRGGVRCIAMRCAGFDRLDLAAADRLGIKVVRVPTYSPSSVAEHAVALMFALNRNLHNAYLRTLQGNYSLNGMVGFEMKNKTVGVMGTGAIGYEACRILKGLGCEVVAFDLHPSDKVTALGVSYVSMEELLQRCDIVSLHCPLLPTTRHLINKQRLSLMKPGAMLINVSRGGLVQSQALFDALESGQLGAVGMDVYEDEQEVFFVDYTQYEVQERMKKWDRQFKALLTYPQVLITPHSAFLTKEALDNIATTTIDNLTNFALGRDLGPNEVKYKPLK